jgi:hypothetical protein
MPSGAARHIQSLLARPGDAGLRAATTTTTA